mgnify:CR=1 FL=1
MRTCCFLLFAALLGGQTEKGVMLSRYVEADFALTADPGAPAWRDAPFVVAASGRYGEPMPEARTEIRSRWTGRHLYFLFISKYESLHLRPEPNPEKETWGLWDYDVVEVFIGHDLENINRYKEFEVSPQNDWVDLDVDRGRPGKTVDWRWNSGMKSKTRIDKANRIWYCEMQIPWPSIDTRQPAAGNELRLNLYRIEGAEPNRKFIAWQPVNNPSYHTPEAFGRLRLVK